MRGFCIATALVASAALLAACGDADGPTAPAATLDAMIVSVVPRGGATSVDPATPLVVRFSHPMGRSDIGMMGTGASAHGMEMIVALHEGTLAGAAVPGTTAWSADRTTLTFTPTSPLERATTYTLFLGGRMTTSDGRTISHESCMAMGGHDVGGAMMGGAMMGGGMMGGGLMGGGLMGGGLMGGGMMGDGMMGDGAQHGDDAHGMTFTFTTT